MKNTTAVSGNTLFRGLTKQDTALALQLFDSTKKEYRRGEILFCTGQPVRRFGLVICGKVCVESTDIDGRSVLMANVTPGNTFAESLCFLGTDESPVTAKAAENTEILWLSAQALFAADARDDFAREMQKRFCAMLAARTLSMNDRIQVLSRTTIRERVLTLLSQYNTGSGSGITLPFDRESLALYIGVNRSALSRELSAMKRDGIIDFYKNSFRLLR